LICDPQFALWHTNLTPFPRFQLPLPQSAKFGREIHFYALRARTPESLLVEENDVSALLADQSPVGQNGHSVELAFDNAIRTTHFFFLRHFMPN
jgi:hypothetical protein